MDNRQNFSTPALITAFAILAVIVGIFAFWLGQRPPTDDLAGQELTPIAAVSPDMPTKHPPVIVTNTPTATPTPSPTVGPTNTPTATPTDTPVPTATPEPTPTPILRHINSLGRLETTEYVMQTVINLENDPDNIWQRVFGSDKLMLMVEGEVVAGFDLEQIESKDIITEGDSVKIILPAPEILYSRIDNENTYVYERRTGLFVSPDQTLEGRARQFAEEALVEWAIDHGIFERAERDGRLRIESLLRSLGFTDITIEFKEREI